MGEEQRQFHRVPAEFQVQCRERGTLTAPWQSVSTTDLSAGGISFQSESMLEVQGSMDIQITLPNFRVPLVLHGTVVRVRSMHSGMSDCAIQFTDVSPAQQEEIDELVRFLRQGI